MNQPTAAAIRFHLCLNVSNLVASIEFFTSFFGVPPAKVRADYAKFETDNPPLVLSLEHLRPGNGGVLNHVGLRMPDADSLVAMQRRLELLGIKTKREDGIECCYSKQTKFWLFDPDGTLWEVYTLDGDSDHHECAVQETASMPVVSQPQRAAHSAAQSIWSHRLGQPFPSRMFVEPGSVDEIRLEGTFNMTSTREQRSRLLQACFASLKSGGTLHTHQLTSDGEIAPELLCLEGAATVVEMVLPIDQLTEELAKAGFSGFEFLRNSEEPNFIRGLVELRETILVAIKEKSMVEY